MCNNNSKVNWDIVKEREEKRSKGICIFNGCNNLTKKRGSNQKLSCDNISHKKMVNVWCKTGANYLKRIKNHTTKLSMEDFYFKYGEAPGIKIELLNCKHRGCTNKIENNHSKYCKYHSLLRKRWRKNKEHIITRGKKYGNLEKQLEIFFKKHGKSVDELIVPTSKCKYFGCFEVGKESNCGTFSCSQHIELVKFWLFYRRISKTNSKRYCKNLLINFHLNYGYYPGEKPEALLKAFIKSRNKNFKREK